MAKADKLGVGWLDLVNIEPFQATKQTVKLTTSDGTEHGFVEVRLVFRPEVSGLSSVPSKVLISSYLASLWHELVLPQARLLEQSLEELLAEWEMLSEAERR